MGPVLLMFLFSLGLVDFSSAKACLGCEQSLDTNDPSIYEYLSNKLKDLKNNVPEGMENETEAELVGVLRYQKQVVSGVRYSYYFEARGLTTNKLYDCTLIVDSQPWKNIEQVMRYTCQVAASNMKSRAIVGGEVILDVENNDYLEKLKSFIGQEVGKVQGSMYLMRVIKYLKATRQIVAGTLIKATLEAAETNCHLNETYSDNHCQYQLQNRQVCDVHVLLRPWIGMREVTEAQCRPQTNFCAGCPVEADTNDAQIRESVERMLSNLNGQSISGEKLTLVKINKATSQVIAGVKYTVEFDAEDENHHNKSYSCSAVIISQPWISKEPVVEDFKCSPVSGY